MELFKGTNMNRLGIAGYGFVGQAHAQLFEDYHQVLVNDPDKEHFADLQHADAIIVCVATPPDNNGHCDFTNIVDVIDKAPDVPILIKSTISLEGWRYINQQYPNKDIAFSPEFLRAEHAFTDFKYCREILIGGKCVNFWQGLLLQAFGNINILHGDPEELILAKYFRNAFLATKVSFFNQIYDMCDAASIDYNSVKKFITMDSRIGNSHTDVTNQRGYGGHCLPKDTLALTNTALTHNVKLSILDSTIDYNNTIRKDIT